MFTLLENKCLQRINVFPDEGNLPTPPELLILCPVPVDISETGLGFNAGGLEHHIQQSSGKGPGCWEFIMVTSRNTGKSVLT